MTPERDFPFDTARSLIVDPVQAAKNIRRFREYYTTGLENAPAHWVGRGHGMVHLLEVLLKGSGATEGLETPCIWDMLDVLADLELAAKPDPTLDTILP